MGFARQEYWSGVPLPSPNKLLVTTTLLSVHETLSETALETEIGCVSTGKKLLQKSSWTTYYHCQVLEKA